MPDWGEILKEIGAERAQHPRDHLDRVRKKYLALLGQKTQRTVILYASKWTQADPNIPPDVISVSIEDVQGLMEVMHGIQSNQLDLLLHSPGGSLEAAEAIVSYLRSKFNYIRVIIPNAAMSAATVIACGADEIMMGKHSYLGPIDPQMILLTPLGTRMVPAQAILDQFDLAKSECSDPNKLASWLPMLSQYGPDLLIQCTNALKLSQELVRKWLPLYMFKGQEDATEKANHVAAWLSNHGEFKTHSRFLTRERLRSEGGLEVHNLEDDQELQDLVLSVFHAVTHTFNATPAVKIIENHEGKAFIKQIQAVMVNLPIQGLPPAIQPPAQQPIPPPAEPPVAE